MVSTTDKDVEEGGWAYFKVLSLHPCGETAEKPQNTSVSIASNIVEI
jgi:hypothetical protein